MTDFNEAVDNFRTAQLLKLTRELQQEKEAHCVMRELAVDRGERIIELARVVNDLKDERDKLLADSRRLAYLIKARANVEFSERSAKYWLLFPDDFAQTEMFETPEEAIDAAMESENV